jgi:hypothetical protein
MMSCRTASCADGGHFVACVPFLAGTIFFGPPLVGDDDPDQRESLYLPILP